MDIKLVIPVKIFASRKLPNSGFIRKTPSQGYDYETSFVLVPYPLCFVSSEHLTEHHTAS
jgi:hypothetical protein